MTFGRVSTSRISASTVCETNSRTVPSSASCTHRPAGPRGTASACTKMLQSKPRKWKQSSRPLGAAVRPHLVLLALEKRDEFVLGHSAVEERFSDRTADFDKLP